MPGAGLYEVGPGKTYATPNAAINQLVIDQGTDPFTATQTIRIYTDVYTSAQNEAIIDLKERGLVPTSAYLLIIERASGNFPVFDCTSTYKYGIYISSISHVTVDGIEIENAVWYEIFVYSDDIFDTDHIIIQNCNCHNAINRHGITLTGSAVTNAGPQHCIVQDNITYDNNNGAFSAGGIVLWYGAANNVIQRNTVYNNVRGIEISNTSVNNEVRNNVCYSNSEDGISINNVIGNSPIDGNRCYGNTNYGIYLYQTGNNAVITNNICYDNNDGIGVLRFQIGTKIYGNILFSNTRYGIYFYYTTSSDCKNNIVHDNGTHQIYCASETSFTSNYNDLFKDSGTYTGYWSGDRETLGNWQTATSQDANSVAQDPLYIDEVGRDLHIQSSSPCKNSGTDLSGTYDIDFDGNTRPWGCIFDMGAYEWVPVSKVAGVAKTLINRVAGVLHSLLKTVARAG